MTRQPTEQNKIFVNHISDEDFSRIYNVLLWFSNKKTTQFLKEPKDSYPKIHKSMIGIRKDTQN